MDMFLVFFVFVAKLCHQPCLPVQRSQIYVYDGHNVYDKQVCGHKWSEHHYYQGGECERISYPSINAMDIKRACFRGIWSRELCPYFESLGSICKSSKSNDPGNQLSDHHHPAPGRRHYVKDFSRIFVKKVGQRRYR